MFNYPFTMLHSANHESTASVNADNGYMANSKEDTFGIVVGTGTAVEDFEDHALAAQIDHGFAAGELYYGAARTPANDQWTDANRTWKYKLTRYFDNFSVDQATITVNEMAQYSQMKVHTAIAKIMMARDLVSPGLDIPYLSQGQITYTYSLFFPPNGSPLRNWYNMVFSLAASLNASDSGSFGDGQLNAKDTSGAIRSGLEVLGFASERSTTHVGNAYRGSGTTMGMLAGDGNTSVTFDDFAMDSLITDGTASGELQYASGVSPAGSWDLPTLTYTVSHVRTLTNGSGAEVIIREIGLVGSVDIQGERNIMTHRDVISPLIIPVGDDLQTTHQFNTVFPE